MSSETFFLRPLVETPNELVFAEVLGFGDVYNLSHAPTNIETATVSDVLVNDGESIAVAEAIAAGDADDGLLANLFSSTESSGLIDLGTATVIAESDAQVVASFFIDGGETFSFDFDLLFDLYSTEIEIPDQAYTEAEIINGFHIYETSDFSEPDLLGFFEVGSFLVSSEMTGDAIIEYEIIEGEANVEFFDEADLDIDNNNEIDLISGLVFGTYEHEFDVDSHVTVVHVINSGVQVLKDMLIGSLDGDITYGTLIDDILEVDGEVYASLGNDEIYGGDGNDIQEGGAGDDSIAGNGGKDRAYGGRGADVVNGGDDDDELHGGDDDDIVLGGAGNDLLDGGSGNDQLSGGPGESPLASGSDYETDAAAGVENANSAFEIDTAVYHGVRAGYEITEVEGGHQVRDIDPSDGDEGTDQLRDVEFAKFDDGYVPVHGVIPVRISFKSEGAGFANSFGIYDKSTMKAELLDATLDDTNEGDVLYEAELTPEEFNNLGFFLLPDGYDENVDLASLVGEELMVVNTADGYAMSATGTPLSGAGAPALFSDPTLNPGGLDHFVENGTAAHTWLTVEDLAGGGDLDYDDAQFMVEAGVPMTGAEVTVTFEGESAGFRNTFGYFIEGTDKAEIIFADIDKNILAHGTTETFDLTAEEHKKLEFFLIPNGATKNGGLFSDLDAIDLIIEEVGGVLQARDEATGAVLEGFVNPVYVPEKSGNPDATRHALKVGDVDDFMLSWEDLPSGGDKDYNDTGISVEIAADHPLI